MLKMKQILVGILSTALFSSLTSVVNAQSNSSIASLGQMPCQEVDDLQYSSLNRDIPIGREIFRAVGRMFTSSGSHYTINSDDNGSFVCRLAAAGQRPVYKTLNLAFGLSDDHSWADESVVRLSIYLDGNFYQYQDITKGQKLLWPIDVTDVRSIALESECLRGVDRGSVYGCADLILFEDTLE